MFRLTSGDAASFFPPPAPLRSARVLRQLVCLSLYTSDTLNIFVRCAEQSMKESSSVPRVFLCWRRLDWLGGREGSELPLVLYDRHSP